MKQGTVSVLIGCHSIVHSIMVVRSWKILYGKYPELWKIVCIFLHDIGHIGLNYLDDHEQKKKHWRVGAKIAYKLFGQKGYTLCAGHCSHSIVRKSELYKADKYSWYITPRFFLWLNMIFEPKLKMGYPTINEALDAFIGQVRVNIESGKFNSTHKMYLDRCKK